MTRIITRGERRLGTVAAAACAVLTLAYATTIVLLMPCMVVLMAAVHAWASVSSRTFTLLAVIFVSLPAVVTSCVHFVILNVGRTAISSGGPGMPLLFSFTWPSVVYALDVLAQRTGRGSCSRSRPASPRRPT